MIDTFSLTPLRTAWRGRVGFSLLALLATGCSLQPLYHRPALPVPAAYPTGPAYGSPPSAGDDANGAAAIGWRDFLTDPRLQRLVEVALSSNSDMRVAALNIAQVQAQFRIQRAALLPQLNGLAGATSSRAAGATTSSGNPVLTHTYSVGLSASWEMDFFGRLQSLRDQALQQYLATIHAKRAVEILLVSQVADQYLTLLAFDELLAVTTQTIGASQASFELIQGQLRSGTATELALRQAQSVVELARANLAAQRRERAQAENALVLLLGAPIPSDLPPVLPLNRQSIIGDVPAGLPSDLLRRRPDILQAEAMLRAATANIGAARAAFFPSISLTAGLGTASTSLSGLFAGGTQAWTFLPSLSLPIFNAGRLEASLDVATVQADINVAQYEKAIQTAFREVADALAARGTYGDQVASLERYEQAQRSALELSQALFKAGVTSYLQVLTAQTSLYSAQQSLVSVRLAQLVNLVDLYRCLGGGWLERTDAGGRISDVRDLRQSETM